MWQEESVLPLAQARIKIVVNNGAAAEHFLQVSDKAV